MYLSRLTLKRSPDVAALGDLLDPRHAGRRLDAHHRLVWSAFAGDPEAKRDFLWRDMGGGVFLVLSPRPPGESALFEAPEVQPFAPDIAPGDRLAFVLRANATRTVTEADGKKRHRDVVMEALHGLAQGARAARRLDLAQEVGRRWLDGQGARAGVRVHEAGVAAYDVAEPPGQGARRPRFGILDLEGLIEVTDPAAFLARFRWEPGAEKTGGFGRAKAFGCGLMLIRRA
ncbi:MAG: type I-E CRISPR-associated protein Cas6/Cse3/CasE [Tabrizicola sp.]